MQSLLGLSHLAAQVAMAGLSLLRPAEEHRTGDSEDIFRYCWFFTWIDLNNWFLIDFQDFFASNPVVLLVDCQ